MEMKKETDANKYSNAKIYKIVDNGYTKTYFGSTTQSLSKRMAVHRHTYRTGKNLTSVREIFDEFGVDNCKIELVESVNCLSKEELEKVEGTYIKENECVNKRVAGVNQKLMVETRREEKLEARKEITQSCIEKRNAIVEAQTNRLSTPFDPYLPKEYYTKKFFVRMTVGDKQSVHDNSKRAFQYYTTHYPEMFERFGGTENIFRVQLLSGTARKSIKGKKTLSDVVKLEKIDNTGKVVEKKKKSDSQDESSD